MKMRNSLFSQVLHRPTVKAAQILVTTEKCDKFYDRGITVGVTEIIISAKGIQEAISDAEIFFKEP